MFFVWEMFFYRIELKLVGKQFVKYIIMFVNVDYSYVNDKMV